MSVGNAKLLQDCCDKSDGVSVKRALKHGTKNTEYVSATIFQTHVLPCPWMTIKYRYMLVHADDRV